MMFQLPHRATKSAKLSRRNLWSFFTVVIVVDLAITLLLFLLYSGMQVSKVTEYSVAQLDQVGTSTDILYQSLEALSNQALADSDTYSFLLSRETNRLQEARAGAKLKSLRSANPYLRYITLYNNTSRRFISTSCAGTGDELGAAVLYNYLGQSPYACFVRQVGNSYNTQKSETVTVYTFVFRLNVKTGAPGDLVVLDVNDSYFNKALSNIRLDGTKQDIILADTSGNIISEMTAGPDQPSFATTSERVQVGVLDISHTAQRSGSFSTRDGDGVQRFVT